LLRRQGRVQVAAAQAGAEVPFYLQAASSACVSVALASDSNRLFTKYCMLSSRDVYVLKAGDVPFDDATLSEAAATAAPSAAGNVAA
jgi:hypothetical protein